MAYSYCIVDTITPLNTQLAQPNTIYEIQYDFDLHDGTIQIGANSVLRFLGGSFSNGNIQGTETSVDAIRNYEVFNGVILTGTWVGEINDLLFHYDPSYLIPVNPAEEGIPPGQPTPSAREDFTPILRNLLQFEKIDLFRNEYFLNWNRVYSASDSSIRPVYIYGHGATWYIRWYKGAKVNTQYGPQAYSTGSIVYFFHKKSAFHVEDLNIVDNKETSPYPGYGEENVESVHTIYSIFEGLAHYTSFENVNYDGGGKFLSSYNYEIKADKLVFKDCNLHTNGFSIEIMCRDRTADFGPEYIGSLHEARIDGCIIHNHYSQYVGPLSFVGEGGIDSLVITNTKICGYRGNLEVMGVNVVFIDNSVLVNQGLSSESSNGRPRLYKCSNSCLYLTVDFHGMGAFNATGKSLYLINNYIYLTSRLEFNDIDRLYCYGNNIVVPSAETNYVFVVGSVKIGYYAGNHVAAPHLHNGQVSVRLDTPYVLAQYSPFEIAYNDHSEKNGFCYTFNPWVGLTAMSSFQTISTDANGYARTNGESLVLNAISPVYDTFSFSLIGRSFSFSGIHDVASITIGTYTLKVEQNYGWIYYITVNNSLLCPISGQDNNAENQDVRLDITCSQINGSFEVFVFVNNELKARYCGAPLNNFIPGGLTITPNSSTGIQAVRLVPGGNIVDEPQTLITTIIDE